MLGTDITFSREGRLKYAQHRRVLLTTMGLAAISLALGIPAATAVADMLTVLTQAPPFVSNDPE
jgi:hypothetical protein